MLIAIILTFLICWGPKLMFRIVRRIDPSGHGTNHSYLIKVSLLVQSKKDDLREFSISSSGLAGTRYAWSSTLDRLSQNQYLMRYPPRGVSASGSVLWISVYIYIYIYIYHTWPVVPRSMFKVLPTRGISEDGSVPWNSLYIYICIYIYIYIYIYHGFLD